MLGVANNEHDGANSNNIIFPKKIQYYMSLWSFYQQKAIKKMSKLLSKEFERSMDWNKYNTKSETKNSANEYRYSLKICRS